MMKIEGRLEPTQDYVLIAPHQQKSASKIIMPDNIGEQYKLHRVVAVGPGAVRDGMFVEPRVRAGQVILMAAGGIGMALADGQFLISERQIVAIVHEEEAAS